MKKWKLDEAEVYELGGHGYHKHHGHPAKTLRSVQITLVHKPTGLQVSRSSPMRATSRHQAAELRKALHAELLRELEMCVARHLRIPGR